MFGQRPNRMAWQNKHMANVPWQLDTTVMDSNEINQTHSASEYEDNANLLF